MTDFQSASYPSTASSSIDSSQPVPQGSDGYPFLDDINFGDMDDLQTPDLEFNLTPTATAFQPEPAIAEPTGETLKPFEYEKPFLEPIDGSGCGGGLISPALLHHDPGTSWQSPLYRSLLRHTRIPL